MAKNNGEVLAAQKLDAYLVKYKDKAGKESVRIAFHFPGQDLAFLLAEKVGDAAIAIPASSWFGKALAEKAKSPAPVSKVIGDL